MYEYICGNCGKKVYSAASIEKQTNPVCGYCNFWLVEGENSDNKGPDQLTKKIKQNTVNCEAVAF